MTSSRYVFILLLLFLAACDRPGDSADEPNLEAIEGVVTGPNGPEAGVWVIAETMELPTRYVKIVVTNDEGQYVIPELPAATYDIWARGYGIVDSEKIQAQPGATADLATTAAPDEQTAAEIYPAGYWYSLLEPPSADEFPGTGAVDGIGANIRHQADFLRQVKSGNCTACHQIGTKGTREFHASFENLESFPDGGTSEQKWERRLMAGQAGGSMTNSINRLGKDRVLKMFADWTDRIEAGEVPPMPPRPQGVERNVVITQWDWADPRAYLHDVVSTDRRDPTVNANGPVYGALELSADYTPVVDPVTHTASTIPLSPRDPDTPRPGEGMPAPSTFFGEEVIWTSQTNVHNPMIDHLGRVWLTAAVRGRDNLDFCKEGSDHPSAQIFPVERSYRHLAVWDPGTQELTHVATCYSTHHLMFAEDENHTLWTSGGGPVVGWLDTKMFDETGDEQASQGWTPIILDTNGNGQRDEYVEPNDPVDPSKDKRINAGFYAVAPAPDGSVWATTLGYPGGIIRLVPGPDPTHTALAEFYQPPLDESGDPIEGWSPRGGDVDRNGIYWAALSSGHMASFDRSQCAVLNGPTATGQHCPEGWTFYEEPLPQMKGLTVSGSAEGSYYTWVDQFNTLGLGDNTPINTGNASEALLALDDGEWVVLRVPYPTGFYTKWMDGRIDDPNAGWKGRGVWTTISTRAPFHMETGAGTTSKVMKFQLRPDPLAK